MNRKSLYRGGNASGRGSTGVPAVAPLERGPRQDESKVSDRFDRHGQDVIEGRRSSAKTACGAVVVRGTVRA